MSLSTRVSGQIEDLRRLSVELWRGGRGPILIAVASGWFLSLGVRMIYPAVLPQLRTAYGLDLTTAGLLISALWVAYALGQLPGGMLDDRFGGRRVLVASTGISAFALTLVVTAGSIRILFGATLLFGFATALYGVARFTILSGIYRDRAGTAIGLTMATGDLGNTVLPPLAGVFAVLIAWEIGFAVMIPLFLVAAFAIYIAIPSDRHNSETGNLEAVGLPTTLRRIGRALYNRPLMIVFSIQTLGYCIWQAFTAFYPTYLIEVKGLDPTTATILFGGFFALGILVKPATGSAYDKYGLCKSLPILLVALTAAMLLLPLVEGVLPIIIITVISSSLLGYSTITLTYLTESFPDDVQGTGLGSLRTGYMLIGAGSPTVVGRLADIGYFDEAFFLLAGVGTVTILLSLLTSEK